jgi:hypothetical protein
MSSLCSKSIPVQILQGHWGMLLVCYRKEDRSGAPKMIDVCRRDGEQFDLVGLKQWA